MGQPVFGVSAGLAIAKIGGAALPNGQSALRAAMLADAPIALWRMTEAPGATVLADEMAGAHPGNFVEPVMKGMPGLVPDSDTSLGFTAVPGTVGYASVPWAAALAPVAPWSIAIVFMAPSMPWAGNAGLFDGRLSTTNGFFLGFTNAGALDRVPVRDGDPV